MQQRAVVLNTHTCHFNKKFKVLESGFILLLNLPKFNKLNYQIQGITKTLLPLITNSTGISCLWYWTKSSVVQL